MNIGDKIKLDTVETATVIKEIVNVVPVLCRDDGDEAWYEVCDAYKTSFVAIVGKDFSGNDVIIIFDKTYCDFNLLLDLF